MQRSIAICLLGLFFLTACTDFSYYVQCASGHWNILRNCRPIDDVISDPDVSAEDRMRLETMKEIRNFATVSLGLPENDSYRKFADIGRPYVVWNVVAAPELSMEPKQWCFPVAGCVPYRGYFDEVEAQEFAEVLKRQGFDVDIYGVQAYSTLNWFDDPVLNTFLSGSDISMAALVFHELTHQVAYVPDDSRFNEAFAKTVEMEGVRRWLSAAQKQQVWPVFVAHERRVEQFVALLMQTRTDLQTLYVSTQAENRKRQLKQHLYSQLRSDYDMLKLEWGGFEGFDAWFDREVNNARLASVATYRELVPAFQALLANHDGDLPSFYASVVEISQLPSSERLARLNSYIPVYQARRLAEIAWQAKNVLP